MLPIEPLDGEAAAGPVARRGAGQRAPIPPLQPPGSAAAATGSSRPPTATAARRRCAAVPAHAHPARPVAGPRTACTWLPIARDQRRLVSTLIGLGLPSRPGPGPGPARIRSRVSRSTCLEPFARCSATSAGLRRRAASALPARRTGRLGDAPRQRYATQPPVGGLAETWAHYLHLRDTRTTARSFGLDGESVELNYERFGLDALGEGGAADAGAPAFLGLVNGWMELTGVVNELSRSHGRAGFLPLRALGRRAAQAAPGARVSMRRRPRQPERTLSRPSRLHGFRLASRRRPRRRIAAAGRRAHRAARCPAGRARSAGPAVCASLDEALREAFELASAVTAIAGTWRQRKRVRKDASRSLPQQSGSADPSGSAPGAKARPARRPVAPSLAATSSRWGAA